MIEGLFDIHFRLDKIDKNGDPLARLSQIVDWDIFRPELESIRDFLGLTIGGKVPDATTVWRFREALSEAGLVKNLFKKSDKTNDNQHSLKQ